MEPTMEPPMEPTMEPPMEQYIEPSTPEPMMEQLHLEHIMQPVQSLHHLKMSFEL